MACTTLTCSRWRAPGRTSTRWRVAPFRWRAHHLFDGVHTTFSMACSAFARARDGARHLCTCTRSNRARCARSACSPSRAPCAHTHTLSLSLTHTHTLTHTHLDWECVCGGGGGNESTGRGQVGCPIAGRTADWSAGSWSKTSARPGGFFPPPLASWTRSVVNPGSIQGQTAPRSLALALSLSLRDVLLQRERERRERESAAPFDPELTPCLTTDRVQDAKGGGEKPPGRL